MNDGSLSLLRMAACAAGLLALGACGRGGAKTNASPATSASQNAPSSSPGGCLTTFDLLFPFQKYGDADLVRGIFVDGDQAYFRTYTEVYRVPIAGGTSVSMSKMAGGLMDSRTWVVGNRFIAQSPGEPIFMALPKAGGTWTTIVLPVIGPTTSPDSCGLWLARNAYDVMSLVFENSLTVTL